MFNVCWFAFRSSSCGKGIVALADWVGDRPISISLAICTADLIETCPTPSICFTSSNNLAIAFALSSGTPFFSYRTSDNCSWGKGGKSTLINLSTNALSNASVPSYDSSSPPPSLVVATNMTPLATLISVLLSGSYVRLWSSSKGKRTLRTLASALLSSSSTTSVFGV